MRVATSPAFLEACANCPRVRPYIGGGLGLFAAGESWKHTVGLEWDTGGIVFVQHSPGIYSGHWVFLPGTTDVVAKARDALRHMFTETNALKITGKTPLKLRHARKAAQAAGMRHLFDCAGYSYTEISRAQWLTDEE